MPTKEIFESRLTEAMRAKDEVGKRTFRMILSAVKLAEVEKHGMLDEPALLGILQKEAKNRQEAVAEAEKAGRQDLASDSARRIGIDLIVPPSTAHGAGIGNGHPPSDRRRGCIRPGRHGQSDEIGFTKNPRPRR